ncbi:hypothetical protein CYY_003126 [Polysphondylium violaceum]|uniref:Uncharacterized protein n=1 Tax=Polysphondylium violaceum TaxID=133409 RepID=A0A8J4V1M2_9MYCE|nr:hypothetical protein CYY_003126 [Polysphondylium violaceum]
MNLTKEDYHLRSLEQEIHQLSEQLREVKDVNVNKSIYMKKCNIYFLQNNSQVIPTIQNEIDSKTKEIKKIKESKNKEIKKQQHQQEKPKTTTTTTTSNNSKQFTPNIPPKSSRFKQQRNQDQNE